MDNNLELHSKTFSNSIKSYKSTIFVVLSQIWTLLASKK